MGSPKATLAGTAVALAALAAGVGWVITSQKPAPAPAPPPQDRPAPSQFRGVELTEQDADGTRWRVSAAEGSAWESGETGELQGVQAVFERRGRALRVTAGRGGVKGGETVSLSEDVKVEWDSYEATLDRVTYERGAGMIRSGDPVEFRGPGIRVTGRGLVVDVEGRAVHVTSDVRATLSAEPVP
ncbi:MAG: LPS export ABC transporter periplasmic protein LptC [Deltaproteobacteria bacterium]|nr:LPS export ABC transporter periplasmic protein LptC [Deltaproteobacteria bacterium]